MTAALGIEREKIDRIVVVELIDLIFAVDDGNVPFQLVDEYRFAIPMHLFERRTEIVTIVDGDDIDHDSTPSFVGEESHQRRRGCDPLVRGGSA